MATTILMLLIVLSAMAFTPLIGNMRHYNVHGTDLMAGDEGED